MLSGKEIVACALDVISQLAAQTSCMSSCLDINARKFRISGASQIFLADQEARSKQEALTYWMKATTSSV